MKRLISNILTFILLFCCFTITAQVKIEGTVQEKLSANVLPNISITVTSKNQIIAYTYTNFEGKYLVTLPDNIEDNHPLQIIANSLEFTLASVDVTISGIQKRITQNFKLEKNIEKLATVVLQSTEKIKVNRDTISFKLSSFNDGTERTVEDMLKKLPGIEVSKEGNIKALGKPISKILIEGDDLADSNYKVISQNLDVDVLENIEILSNYDENPVLKQFLNSDAVVLNLKLKNNKKAILFGKGEAGGGIANRFLGNLNVGFISPEIKLLDLANTNNTGKPAQTQFNDYAIVTNGFNDFDKQFKVSTRPIVYLQGATIAIPDNNYIENTSFANNLLTNKRFNDSLKIRNSLYAYKDTFQKNYFNTITYLLDNPLNFSENNVYEYNDFTIQNDFQLNYTPSKNSNIVANVNVLLNNNENINDLTFNNVAIDQQLNVNKKSLDGQFQYTKKLKNGALIIDGYAGSNNLRQNYEVSPNLIAANNNSGDNDIISENEITLDYQGVEASTVFKNDKSVYSFTAGFKHLQETIQTNAFNIAEIQSNTIDSLTGNTRAKSFIPHFNIKGEIEFAKNIFLQGDFNTALNDYKKNNFNNTFFIPNLMVGLAIRKKPWGSLSVLYRHQNKLPRLINFTENFILTSYRSIEIGQDIPELLTSNNYTLNYTFARIKKQILFQSTVSYTTFNNILTSISLLSQNTDISQRIFAPGQKIFLFNTGFTTYIPAIDSSAKIGVIYNYNETPLNLNGNLTNSKNQTTTYLLKGTTYFNGIINFKALVQYVINSGKTLSNEVINNRYNFEGKSIITFSESIQASLTHNGFIIASQYYETTNMAINYKPNKKNWTLELQIKNLMNNNAYVFENVTDYVQSQTVFTSVPRYILATGTFQF